MFDNTTGQQLRLLGVLERIKRIKRIMCVHAVWIAVQREGTA